MESCSGGDHLGRFYAREVIFSVGIFRWFLVIPAQNHFDPGLLGSNRFFFTGTPRSGTPRPIHKHILFVVCKDLGVIFQQDLKFSNHIATKVNKANSMLSLIVRTFQFIEQDSFILMYKANVRPNVEYGNTIWYPHLRRDIESKRIQKQATKQIPQLKDLTYNERLKKLKLPTLAHHRRRGDMLQTFKILHKIEDIPSERFFTIISNTSTRGHNFKFEKPRCRTSFRLQHFFTKNYQRLECSSIICC